MTAHGSMHERDRTQTQRILRELGVTYDALAHQSGVSRASVHRYLAMQGQGQIRYGHVMRIRSAVYAAVIQAQRQDLMALLFKEHDRALYQEIVQEMKARPAWQDATPAAMH